jgi:hypothetical protein
LFFTQCNDKEIVNTPSKYSTNFISGRAYLASHAPEVQTFTKDIGTAFSITTKGGLKFDFPANAFRDGGFRIGGIAKIEITEYLSNADMIFGGITTSADDQLLQSGGMFNIEVRQDGKLVDLAETYQVGIPTDNIDQRMQIFEGQESISLDGEVEINWVNADSSWVNQTSFDSFYRLNLNFLSWCNLDRYYNATDGAQVRLKLPSTCTNENTTVYMVFDENSVVYLYGDAGLEEFNSGNYNLPLGWDIKLLAVSVIDEELQYTLVNSVITDPHLETVTAMTKVTEEELEDIIKDL